jgi:hypothetical protein
VHAIPQNFIPYFKHLPAYNYSLCNWIQRPQTFKKTPWPEPASELYRPSDRRLSAKLVLTFADRGCHVVSVTEPHGRILGFLDRSRYFFFQVAPELYSRGCVDTVPDSLLLRKSGSAGNWTGTSGSLAKSSDHYSTEAVYFLLNNINSVHTSQEAQYISVV